jgi:exodeoxyribonuclease VIII
MSTQLNLPVVAIIPGMPWDEYLALDALNASKLKVMAHSAKHYRHNIDHGKESDILSLGKAAHCAVLEPERFQTDFAVWRRRADNGNMAPRKGQYWDAFEAENRGKILITENDETDALTMQSAIRSDASAMKYLAAAGQPEVTMRWMLGRRPCKARVDWLTGRVLVGMKSAADVRRREFSNAAARLGYHLSWSYYADGYEAIIGHPPEKMIEIVVEKSPPHDVVVHVIPDRVLEVGRQEYLELIDSLDGCEKRGFWPGVGGGSEVEFDLPSYKYEDSDLSSTGIQW